MNIGNTHIDGSLLVAGVLVAAGLLGVYMLYHRPKPPIEHPNQRAIRLAREAGLKPGELYFVPDSVDTAYVVADMSQRARRDHPAGRLVRLRKRQLTLAGVEANENPIDVSDTRFWIAD